MALRCTCSLKFPPLLFSLSPNQFCNVSWPLLLSSPISLSLLIVEIFLLSCICKVLLLIPPHFHFFRPYLFCLFLVYDPLLFVPSPCLRKSVFLEWLLPILPHLVSHLILVTECRINFLCFVLPLFSLLLYWHAVCFQQPKTSSPPPL